MVSTEGPEERNVHFLRKRKQVWEKTPIPAHIWGAPPENADELARQRKALWNHVEVINNWESLPVVLDDTEVLWPYRKVIEKLEVLAGIEHALAVEYLHAYHSVDPKFVLDGHPVGRQARDVLLKIATDEMRHLRWVNEILILLDDRRTVIDRADNYGPNFDWRGFQLRPLDQATLDWFIRIEKPSAQEHVNEQLEGLYIGVQREILYEISEKDATGQPSAFGDRANVQKILSLIKLIMLEGEGHYRQLADLKVRLFSREDTPHHLRPVSARAPSDAIRLALDISDTIYQALLFGLGRLFALGVHGDGSELQQLIDSMHVMSRLNERLAELGYPASFQKPEISPVTEDWDGWLKVLRDHIRDLDRKIGTSAFADAELQQAASAALNKAKRCCRL
jgi:hypothetical protein